MRTINKGELEYIAAETITPRHCFTTCFGGVSEGYLASLNLGLHRGDDPENVRENWHILGRALEFDPQKLVMNHQVHSAIVRTVGEGDWGRYMEMESWPDCDAMISNVPGTVLTAFTADCTPILLWDPVTGAVGAVHAGWRGTVADIAGSTVRAMAEQFGSRPGDLRAAIGPNIAQCCFETDADVPTAVRAILGEEAEAFITARGVKYHVDLKGVNACLLRRAGVDAIELSGDCTACRPARFWSHRRVGNARGSLAAVIVCEGENCK